MGFIREPKGVDFVIQSEPLNDKERKEISKFIQDYKAKSADRKSVKKIRASSSKSKNLT